MVMAWPIASPGAARASASRTGRTSSSGFRAARTITAIWGHAAC
jgi:hypothetical protein